MIISTSREKPFAKRVGSGRFNHITFGTPAVLHLSSSFATYGGKIPAAFPDAPTSASMMLKPSSQHSQYKSAASFAALLSMNAVILFARMFSLGKNRKARPSSYPCPPPFRVSHW